MSINKFRFIYKIRILNIIILAIAFAAGCAESRINSSDSDSPYLNVERPYLALKNEHFGGGYTLENGKRSYFAGGEIFNYGRQSAYSATVRVRIYQTNGAAYDDHNIYLGDIAPAKSVVFEEKFEVISPYADSEVTLTYQEESNKINSVVLKPGAKNINNLDKNSY